MLPIHPVITQDLEDLENFLPKALECSDPRIQQVIQISCSATGKRLRPALFLSLCRAFGHPCSQRILTIATAIEFVHMASLLHDDVVDGAGFRHGKPALHTQFGPHTAILVGDFVFATACTLLSDLGDLRLLQSVATCIRAMAEAEILQSQILWTIVTQDDYLTIVKGKTAALFATAAELAGLVCNHSQPQQIRQFGLDIGMAFQLIDDSLDVFGEATQIGKPVGNDLAEGKLTYPHLHAVRVDPNSTEALLLNKILENKDIDPKTQQDLSEWVVRVGGLEAGRNRANDFVTQALNRLTTLIDDTENEFIKALVDLSRELLYRQK